MAILCLSPVWPYPPRGKGPTSSLWSGKPLFGLVPDSCITRVMITGKEGQGRGAYFATKSVNWQIEPQEKIDHAASPGIEDEFESSWWISPDLVDLI